MHVDDAAAAVVAALARGVPGEAYNIVDDQPAATGDFIREMARMIGAPRPLTVPLWVGRLAGEYAARLWDVSLPTSNAKAELGWQPRYPTYREGLHTLQQAAAVGRRPERTLSNVVIQGEAMAADSAPPTKQPLTFRVRPSTLQHLRRRAHELGQAQTALAERYLEEDLRQDKHPLIHFRDGAGGRRPALIGTRLDVWQVIQTVKAAGNSLEEAAAYLELPVEQVRECVRYYADYTDEIDEWSARAAAVSVREEASLRRQQAVLG